MDKALVSALAVVAFSFQPVLAGSPISGAKDGVAIQGFDTVAYFTDGKAVKGSAQFAHEWAGTPWFFATATNRDAFVAEPAKYAPQYGGHCALSVAYGKTAKGSGDAWHIERGKLYLNANTAVRNRWMPKMSENIRMADAEWPGIKARLEGE